MNAVIYHIITTIRRRGVKKGDHTKVAPLSRTVF